MASRIPDRVQKGIAASERTQLRIIAAYLNRIDFAYGQGLVLVQQFDAGKTESAVPDFAYSYPWQYRDKIPDGVVIGRPVRSD